MKSQNKQMHLNEKEIQSCFSFMNSFWGFDRMVFNLGENLIVDIEKLIEFKKRILIKLKNLLTIQIR